MSSFQSLATAVAAQVGTGNIAGAATAIASGGPGAIFWMWLSAFFGMADGTLILPVSKVSFGFASGGSDFPSKTPKELFGGGSGAGVSISPIAFLVVKDGNVRMIQLASQDASTADRIINALPETLDKLQELFKKDKPGADGQ